MEDLNGRDPNHSQGYGEHALKNSCYGKIGRVYPTYDDKKYPRSILNIKAIHCSEGQFHPTQKPVELLRYLVRTYSNEGDTILDNCMGSATTAFACIRENRHFIGFELDKGYFDKAQKRISLEQKGQPLSSMSLAS